MLFVKDGVIYMSSYVNQFAWVCNSLHGYVKLCSVLQSKTAIYINVYVYIYTLLIP